jgi:hypothetical protein
VAEQSVILKPAVLKSLVAILKVKETNPTAEQLALKVQVIKCLSSLLETLPTFLETLAKQGLLSNLTDFWMDIGITKQKSSTVVPASWLEAKATNMRAHASEFCATLQRDC